MDAAIEVKQLRKTFGNTVALDSVDFTAPRGEIVGLLGPNGAGKTTAISILLGLITPTSGSVHILGKDFAHHRVSILERCNFSSAYASLPTNLKVIENLTVFAKLYGVKDRTRKINSLLERFEIARFRNHITGTLSSGESTRVNLCKALLNDPEVLFLDEPTASLDPDIADKVRKLLRQIQKERQITMLYTSHNMRDVEEVCDRVLFMQRGKILAEGSPSQIMERFQSQSLEDVFIRVARSGDVEDLES